MELSDICLSVCTLCKEVGRFLREQSHQLQASQIETKGLHDLVSYVDKTSEQMIIKRLKELLPEAGFIAEESGNDMAETYNWIIDPLDGTTNYVHHLPMFAISIALQKRDSVVLGVVYEVNNDECFYSWKGGKAYLNDNEIHVSEESDLDNSLIATGFPIHDFSKLDGYMMVLETLIRDTLGVRRCGSAATDLAYVACGRYEGFFEYGLSPWDVAAGQFLVKQAGGKVSAWDGSPNYVFGREIVAGNMKTHGVLSSRLAERFHPVSLVGKTGHTLTDLCPNGMVAIANTTYEASSASGFIEQDTPIKVVSYRLGKMIVEKLR